MKIKYITNVRIPTSRAQGYAIMKMCEEFVKQEADLELIVPNRQNNESTEDPFTYYGIKNRFPIRKIKSIDLLGPYEAFGKLFYWIDMLSFLISLRFKKALTKRGILYTRDYLIPLVFSKKDFICLELHDIPKSGLFFSYLIKRPKIIFVLNRFIKEELVKRGVTAKKIYISPSGVDIKSFDTNISKAGARKVLDLPQDKKVIMYIGLLDEWKGYKTLLEVSNLLDDTYKVVIVGGFENQLNILKKEYPKVIFTGFRQHSELASNQKAADVLVIPNSAKYDISKYYTSPLKVFTHMLSGVPIVASDLPSIREVLNEKNAVFAKPDTPESFKEAIEKILRDDELSCAIIAQAKKDVEQYSWTKRAEKILAVIKENQ